MKTETFVRIPRDDDTPFERAVDRWCMARNEFGAMRGWPGLGGHAGPVEPEQVRAAARALRDACDQLAEMPTWTSDGQWMGGDLGEKARLAGFLLFDAADFDEPWLIEVGMRMATRSRVAHPEDYPQLEDSEAQ